MVLPLIGAGIGAAASLIGGKMAADSNRENAERNIAMQKEFAQQGIRWKVEDAKAAGVHPLYALGANTHSFAPVSFGSTSMGPALASMGQDVGRAISATSTAPERLDNYSKMAQTLQLENASLQNQLLASRIARERQALNPPMPTIGDATSVPVDPKIAPRNRLVIGGSEIRGHPGWSPAETVTNEWGEPAEWAYSPFKMAADMYNHYILTDPNVAQNWRTLERRHKERRYGRPIGRRD